MLSSSPSPRFASAHSLDCWPNRVACAIVAHNEADRIERAILHKSYCDFAQIVVKAISYYRTQREEGIAPSHVGWLRLFIKFSYQFFPYNFLRRHVFGGSDGVAYATALSIGRWARIFILKGW